MNRLFLLPGSARRDASIGGWMEAHSGELGDIGTEALTKLIRTAYIDMQGCLKAA